MALAICGCTASGPFTLRLSAPSRSECEAYETPLLEAVDWWNARLDEPFAYEECTVGDYELQPVFTSTTIPPADTDDLELEPDRVRVYVIDEIREEGKRTGPSPWRSTGSTCPVQAHGARAWWHS